MNQQNPLRNPDFRKLFAAQIIALLGTGLSTVALTLLAYDKVGGNAAFVLGTALAFKMTAYVLFAPVIGGLAHRFRRKPFLLILDLVRAGVILAIPFVTEIWQIYLLIFMLNLFSAGFKPVFSATIPDLLVEERQYTRALSLSRLAYDLETLLSPVLAGLALLFMTYTGLFVANAVAFLISATLIAWTVFPLDPSIYRSGSVWDEISFGIRSYLKTPRLRGLLALYLGVASASAMIIVNTVIYIRENLGGSESDVAVALASAGAGSMIGALGLPGVLDRIPERQVMLFGACIMATGLLLTSIGPSFPGVLSIWFFIGLGWSLVQTPAGLVVNRSSSPADRSAYFSAQFSLSHACWLIFYLAAGYSGTWLGVQVTALILGIVVLISAVLAAMLWPKYDETVLAHTHTETFHEHKHTHGLHHRHDHEGWEGPEPHTHPHRHLPGHHTHRYIIDDHHAIWPESPSP
ncbi:MAG: MFS transporter [Gammaproteobacteria bacterium]|nr:MFS transporter [Gammaproteobacteria bacterium]